MKNLLLNKKNKLPLFQVLLIDNGETDDVQVEEAKKVDYFKVKEHLSHGGSVFITSKSKQKLKTQKTSKTQQSYSKAQKNMGRLMKTHLRNSRIV